MNFEMPNFAVAMPEIFLLAATCAILLADLFVSDKNRVITYLLSILALVITAVLTVASSDGTRVLAFGDSYINDAMAVVLKVFIYLTVIAVFVYSRDYLHQRNLFKGEFFILSLFGVLGMMIMVSAHSFLTLYLGLELLSLAMYAMVALHRDDLKASEAAMKYFVLGAIASGMLLYGMSLLYGVSGTLDLGELATVVAQDNELGVVFSFGLVFVIIGLAFKLGAVPFHMWIPDVYHGAPTAITLFIGTAPKIAGFAMVMRLLVEGLGGLHSEWQMMLVAMAILSLAIGNIIAIAQTNIKRMLAYSTISHVGFLLLGISVGTVDGFAAGMFYVIAYAIMGLAGFGMILLLSRAGFEADKIDDFKGLNERSPWFAFIMLIVMFSMAGVPPALGFYAKLYVLQALVNSGMTWLAVYAVIMSIVGAFYYLRIIKVMYFDKPEDGNAINSQLDMRVILSSNGLGILALGIFPGSLMALCLAVMAG